MINNQGPYILLICRRLFLFQPQTIVIAIRKGRDSHMTKPSTQTSYSKIQMQTPFF